jgi:ABC-type branched-subunit amino acid transport system ATPase component/ABC-type branched-subunit amino acid transport system permease subunit
VNLQTSRFWSPAQTLIWISLGALLPLFLAPFRLYQATIVLIYIVIVVGLNIVMGFTGRISVSHAAFMGIGAYTTALTMGRLEWNIIPAAVAGVVLATVAGYIVGLPALRITGHYLALATLAFQLLISTVILNWVGLTRGPNGIAVSTPSVGSFILADRGLYWVVLAAAILGVLFARNLKQSRIGRAWASIREQDTAASVLGVNVARYMTMSFGVSAAYAGLAGALFAVTVGFLDPLAFTIWESIKHLTMAILGGLGTTTGPIVGATLLTLLPDLLRGFAEHSLLVFYVILILVLLFMPQGLVPGFRAAVGTLRRGRPGQRAETAQTPSPRPVGETEPFASATTGNAPVLSSRLHTGVQSGPREPGPVLLEISDVSLHFGGLMALTHVSTNVRQGEIKGLIGPNGAGKTSLFNILSRVYEPTGGEITFEGVSILARRPHQLAPLGIARTFQNVEMFGDMSVLENVLVGLHHNFRSGLWTCGTRAPWGAREERRARDRAVETLRFLDLEAVAAAPADSLPIGVQRRAEVARAIVSKPRLLLLDEPASGMSGREAEDLMRHVRAVRNAGTTVLLIEHNMRFVMGLSDRVTVLEHGHVIFEGSPEDARRNPKVIEAYLGEDVEDQESVGDHGN